VVICAQVLKIVSLWKEEMEVRISGANKPEGNQFLQQVKQLLDTAQGPLRLSRISEKDSGQEVLFLRERTWGEFFLEKLIRTPQEIEDIENEALAAIELAFFPFISERGSAELASSIENDGRGKASFSSIDNDAENDRDLKKAGLSLIRDMFKDELKLKVLEKPMRDDGTQYLDNETQKLTFKSMNGLCAVPKGLSISTCPALQVVAHNTIVGSVGAVSVPGIQRYSPLERALNAFRTAWRGLETKSIPLSPATGRANQTSNAIVQDVLQRKRGLRHIQELRCIADDINRDEGHPLANQNQNFWEQFYLQGCETMEGSVVRELYPDYYVADRNAPNGRKPFYSENNIKGAIAAAAAIREEQRQGGKEPVSIMFAGMDMETYERMCQELQRVDVLTHNAPRKPPHPQLPDKLLTPDKFPANASTNEHLRQAVRLVPQIRKRLTTDDLEIPSDSESDSENNS
jgi:hypothetical protein